MGSIGAESTFQDQIAITNFVSNLMLNDALQ